MRHSAAALAVLVSPMCLFRISPLAIAILILPVLSAVTQAADLNSYRAAHGRKPLRASAALTAMAQAHASELAQRGSLDHSGFFSTRARAGAVAENVSYGCGNRSCAIEQWSASAPHRANMLRTDVMRYGLASAVSSTGDRYWVMELGYDLADLKELSPMAHSQPQPLRGGDGIEIREWLEDIR